MISSFFRTRSPYVKVAESNQKANFALPESHGASFDQESAYFHDNKENSPSTEQPSVVTRKCYTCREDKPVAAFPMSMRTSRHCRYCSNLNSRGLDPLGVSCEGSLVMKEAVPFSPTKPSTTIPACETNTGSLGSLPGSSAMASGPQFEVSAYGELV